MDEITLLKERLESVLKKQQLLSSEIQELRNHLQKIENSCENEESNNNPQVATTPVEPDKPVAIQANPTPKHIIPSTLSKSTKTVKGKSNLEKFIGENLINKIGIVITVIGVAIGVKYSIDKQLISPLIRIMLGYLLGLGLLGMGIKLKKKYQSYSAVLVSGSMAIMYFITYAAYEFYDLIPQALTFVLMSVFTIFTVAAAIRYNRQVIAHIGLVGAYAIPFLLNNNSGRINVLFIYMTIINAGILFVSCKKYWKSLYYSSFCFTWLIYLGWYFLKYKEQHFALALIFLSIFFSIFYAVFLIYKIIRIKQYKPSDIIPVIINSFLFYGIGHAILSPGTISGKLLGLFTLANAIIHFVVSLIVYKQKEVDKQLFYLLISLGCTFIAIAVPIQLDGHWVTLLWVAETCILFTIGTIKRVEIFKNISYPLILLSFACLVQDWINAYSFVTNPLSFPIFNICFLTSALFVTALGCINYFNTSAKYQQESSKTKAWQPIVNVGIPVILLIAAYFPVLLEINSYYNNKISTNPNWYEFKCIWMVNYSLLFASVLSMINMIKLKSKKWGIISMSLSVFFLGIFLFMGLYSLSELRESYLNATTSYSPIGHILIRYISMIFAGLTVYLAYRQMRLFFYNSLKAGFDMMLHTLIVWTSSSELIHWLDMAGFEETYKVGLSILWNAYALFLITLGIWKRKKYLRIAGMVLLGITLLKLVFYDLQTLDTIKKTIVMVILGLLMLIVSFLYNKYKHLIGNETDDTKK